MTALWPALLTLAIAGGRRHPMHTAVTEVVETTPGAVDIRLRVFVDDFQTAVRLPLDSPAADSAMARYLRGTISLADRQGRPVHLAWAGSERTGDVYLIRLRGQLPGGLAGARITSLILCERFEDQVNIVRATYDGRSTTLLFTGGVGAKALP